MNLGFLLNSEKFQRRLFAINWKITKLSFKLISENINDEEYINSLIERFESSNNLWKLNESDHDDESSIHIYHKFKPWVKLLKDRNYKIHKNVHYEFFNFWKSVNYLFFLS